MVVHCCNFLCVARGRAFESGRRGWPPSRMEPEFSKMASACGKHVEVFEVAFAEWAIPFLPVPHEATHATQIVKLPI